MNPTDPNQGGMPADPNQGGQSAPVADPNAGQPAPEAPVAPVMPEAPATPEAPVTPDQSGQNPAGGAPVV